MKNIIITSVLALFTLASVHAATVIGVLPSATVPIINSASTTNTAVNFPAWPVVANGSVTNFTAINIGNYKEVAIQITCASTNTTTTSNSVWTIYRSVQGIAPTNALGTSLTYDLLGSITNVLAGATSVTAIGTFNANPKTTASGEQTVDNGIGGCTVLYIGNVTTPTGSGLTNYAIYVNGK